MNALRREIYLLKENLLSGRVQNEAAFAAFTTRNAAMKGLFGYLEAVGPTNQPVLITGETGVGKELVARALHELSGRSGAFVAVNSAGLDDLMFADTLFGHRKGAFTGADQLREGMITRAADGTLFLDEIGDLNPASQIKLLRLLQEGEYYPLGSDAPLRNRARIVVATNCGLEEMIAAGAFRKDLYYRLCAHKVHIPPLRTRAEDIPLLLETFLEEAAASLQKKKPGYPPELVTYLGSYHFPGNIRELRAMIFDAVTRHQGGQLSMATFREAIGREILPGATLDTSGAEEQFLNLSGKFPTLKELEQSLIAAAVRRSSGNQRTAAELLGISRQALNQRLSKK
jgi:DNA-binding NtrC family response regulator